MDLKGNTKRFPYLLKTINTFIFFNPSSLDDAAQRIREVNDTQGNILGPLLEMFPSPGLSQDLISSFKKKQDL
jgi:hypothetical protein